MSGLGQILVSNRPFVGIVIPARVSRSMLGRAFEKFSTSSEGSLPGYQPHFRLCLFRTIIILLYFFCPPDSIF